MVAEIPLCKGRSRISEALCPEWIHITTNQIPADFWKVLEDGDGLRDEQTWRAIQQFSRNCIKRQAFEDYIRKKNGVSDLEHISLPERVPDELEDWSVHPLSIDDISSKINKR